MTLDYMGRGRGGSWIFHDVIYDRGNRWEFPKYFFQENGANPMYGGWPLRLNILSIKISECLIILKLFSLKLTSKRHLSFESQQHVIFTANEAQLTLKVSTFLKLLRLQFSSRNETFLHCYSAYCATLNLILTFMRRKGNFNKVLHAMMQRWQKKIAEECDDEKANNISQALFSLRAPATDDTKRNNTRDKPWWNESSEGNLRHAKWFHCFSFAVMRRNE